jgi:hypothetical protein
VFRKAPLGLKHLPKEFQRIMETMLMPPCRLFVRIFLDNIIVFSKSIEEHATQLKTVLRILNQFSVRLNVKKCILGKTEHRVLGNIVSGQGLGSTEAPCAEWQETTPIVFGSCKLFEKLHPSYVNFDRTTG